MGDRLPALLTTDAPLRLTTSNYPEPFRPRVEGRRKAPLGDLFGLRNFGANLTTLEPGAASSLHHQHSLQDEFIYVLEGAPTLVTDAGETQLQSGMVAGFPAGGTAHHLENRSGAVCVILEVGDRTPGDAVSYPSDDLAAVAKPGGGWRFAHKDGRPYV